MKFINDFFNRTIKQGAAAQIINSNIVQKFQLNKTKNLLSEKFNILLYNL